MSEMACRHADVRIFDGIKFCFSCGTTEFEASFSSKAISLADNDCRHKYRHLFYEYSRQIRLVILLPGTFDDPLRCEIQHVNLDRDPLYDAVSYTWATENGDVSLSKIIQCIHGGYIPITANCDSVLRRLRRSGRRTLWVDAICT